jgi:hypothetical protein
MSDISRELRKVADECLIGVANTRVSDLADRIDAEMVELPRGKDGSPIHVGDTVYGEDGRAWHVLAVTIGDKSWSQHDAQRLLLAGNAEEGGIKWHRLATSAARWRQS